MALDQDQIRRRRLLENAESMMGLPEADRAELAALRVIANVTRPPESLVDGDEDEGHEILEVICPYCGNSDEDEIIWQEKVWVKRTVLGMRAGTSEVIVLGDSEVVQDDASCDDGSESLLCCECLHTWLPENGFEH